MNILGLQAIQLRIGRQQQLAAQPAVEIHGIARRRGRDIQPLAAQASRLLGGEAKQALAQAAAAIVMADVQEFQLAQLQAGVVDNPAIDHRRGHQPLFVEQQQAYCGRDHPLFPQAGALGPADLAAHDWAWRSYPLPDTGLPVADWRISARADNMEAIAALVLSGQHLGFLPEHYAAPLAERDLLRALDPARWRYLAEFQLVTRKRGHPNPTLQAFVADLVAAHA